MAKNIPLAKTSGYIVHTYCEFSAAKRLSIHVAMSMYEGVSLVPRPIPAFQYQRATLKVSNIKEITNFCYMVVVISTIYALTDLPSAMIHERNKKNICDAKELINCC